MRTDKRNTHCSDFLLPKLVKSSQQTESETSNRELARRLEYVHSLCSSPLDAASVKLLISEVACRRNEFPPPSLVTVRRWVLLYGRHGKPMIGRPLLGKKRERALKLTLIYQE